MQFGVLCQIGGSGGRLRAQTLAVTLTQERQASYMYIMPLEHTSSPDSPEVRARLVPPCSVALGTGCRAWGCGWVRAGGP